ncbi:MAG: hypothetical protein LCH58_11185 [Bacteroidetes bacterium]|uniref:hypothetical protein n=1 Tax=Phnomibacter sp. TaxID=2836217 RepID=UPI002FDCB5B7|nr:hypothetical protein [Bacteroidota bacterium]
MAGLPAGHPQPFGYVHVAALPNSIAFLKFCYYLTTYISFSHPQHNSDAQTNLP